MSKVDLIMWRAWSNPFDTLTVSATSLMVMRNSCNCLAVFRGIVVDGRPEFSSSSNDVPQYS